jgi:hypothetical protein
MDPAWIAVLGTLGGVIVTSITGVSVGVLTTRGQQLSVERQRSHETAEHRRAERRDTFVEFLAAYSELREKVPASGQQAQANALPRPLSLSPGSGAVIGGCGSGAPSAPLAHRRR